MSGEYSTDEPPSPVTIEATPVPAPPPWKPRAERIEPSPFRTPQDALGDPRESWRDVLRDTPRPSLLGLVGVAHGVLLVATFWYVVETFGWIYGLVAGTVYTLAWIVILAQRADERRRLNRAPAPFRKYDYAPPPGEDRT